MTIVNPDYTAWWKYANAYLPLKENDKRKTAEDVVAWRTKFTQTPIFNSLNDGRFWLEFYSDKERVWMLRQARALDLHVWNTMSTSVLRAKLIQYWIKRMNGETFVPSSL